MSQQAQLREYQLVEMMLTDRQSLRAEFNRVIGDAGGCVDTKCVNDRDMIRAILALEFPSSESPAERW